jgi:hypothetical protein
MSNMFLAVNIAAWFVPLRMTVGDAPDHKPKMPSSRTIVFAQCIGPLYFSRSVLSPFCCCNRIFTTYIHHKKTLHQFK